MKKAKLRYSLSSFPDDILHHIFSFLEFKDIATLRAVSRRFQTLCLFAPSFSFSQLPPYYSLKYCSCRHFYNFMKELRRQRPHNLKIDQLSFSSLCKEWKHRELHKHWLHQLFKAFRVDNLSLKHNLPSILTGLDKLQSLKILKLDMTEPILVCLPSETKLASLERLHVKNIRTQDSVGWWVSQSFPSLKSLLLSRVTCVSRNGLDRTIGSSCLEDLTIECCCGFEPKIIAHNLLSLRYSDCTTNNNNGIFCRDCAGEVLIGPEVCAPNLQRLEWKGAPGRICNDNKTLKNLRVATIFSMKVNFYDRFWSEFPQFFEVIAMHCAKILCVDTHTITRLYERQLITFRDVRQLVLRVQEDFYKGNTLYVLTNFLERLPNLETLILAPCHADEISSARRPFSFENASRECMKIRWWKIRGLKKVKIRFENMYDAMAIMIGMLKKLCPDMEEMSFSYPSSSHKSIKNFLHSVGSASSKLSIKLNQHDRKRERSPLQYKSAGSLKKEK